MAITSPGAIFNSLYSAFMAEPGALAGCGGDVTAGPINCAAPCAAPNVSTPIASSRQRIVLFDRIFNSLPRALRAFRKSYFL